MASDSVDTSQLVNTFFKLPLPAEENVLYYMAYAMIGAGMAAFTRQILGGNAAPYGRYGSDRYGRPVPAKLAWFLQELPSFLIPVLLIFFSEAKHFGSNLANVICLSMMILHYFNR